jgi:homopolymeric O-antigen transport system permease protein
VSVVIGPAPLPHEGPHPEARRPEPAHQEARRPEEAPGHGPSHAASAGHAGDSGPEVVIGARGTAASVAWRELWAYRGLLYFLVRRDLKVRYTQTILGVAWAVLQPLLNTVVFTIVFARLVRVPTDNVPYPVFALAALVPWTYVSTAFAAAGTSLLNSAHLISKVYFPRLVIPVAPVCAAAVDFGVGLVLLGGALAAFRQSPSPWSVLLVPACTAVFALTAAGAGCWMAALSLQYRDVRHLLPFLSTLWMYASPVVYPMSRVPVRYQAIYALNPLAGSIEAFRSALVGRPVMWGAYVESAVAAAVLFLSGALYFRRTERVFADIV